MRIIRPPWLNHGGDKKDAEVYSCHVSPDGKRLATAAGDSHVRIWSTETIFHAADAEYTGPKQLASMSHHLGTIHAVRFSSNGKYLASGADDKYICLYIHDPNPPSHSSTFGTNEPPPVENWRLVRRLPGHDNDVQDLGWSYDSSILVSVGLDSKIVVWSGHTFEKLKIISTHSSHVKGITFDPANKYFATASDDRTIKIFRFTPPAPNSNLSDHLNNFVLEKSISWASHLSPLTTYFRRCSWSPDGNLIAAANSVNGPVSSVAIITRGTWEPGDSSVHLIGHEAPVEVCSFSPQMFSKEAYDPEKPGEHPPSITIIACAGQDKALTVWSTVESRPVIIAHDVCQKSFTDIAWHPDGKSLFATSLDGTITLVSFEGAELGHALPPSLTDQALARFGAGRKGAGIVEGPSELLLEELSKEGEMKDVEDRMAGLMGDKAGNSATAIISSSSQPNGTNSNSKQAEEAQTNGGKSSTTTNPVDAGKSERLKSRITITKDGKKRLAPLLVSSSSTTSSNLPQASLRAATTAAQPTSEGSSQSIIDLSKPFDGFPRGGLTAMLLGNKRKLAQIEGDEDNQLEKRISVTSENGATPILVNTPQGLTLPKPARASDPPVIPEYIRPAVVNPSLTVSTVRLAVPKIRGRILQRLTGSERGPADGTSTGAQNDADAGAALLFEAQNPTGPSPTGRQSDREPSRILVSKGENVRWHDYLPKSVLLLAHGENFWAAACEDGSIYTWSYQGRRLLNAIVLESQPVILEAKNTWLLCITATGLCHVFNMKSLQSPHPPVSLAPILDVATQVMFDQPRLGPAVTSARLTSEGRVCVSISNGDSYSYSPALFTWQRLSEPWWAVGSQYWNSTDAALGNVSSKSNEGNGQSHTSAGIISFLERQTSIESANKGRFGFLQRLVKALLPREGYENLEASISMAHLENRLAAALQLGAKEDFRTYLTMYVKCLGSEVQKGKVEELLADLAHGITKDEQVDGDSVGTASDKIPVNTGGDDLRKPSTMVCGWSKLELLEMVVLILGKQRELSRTVKPYAKIAKGLAKARDDQMAE